MNRCEVQWIKVTPTSLPWGLVYENQNSFAPIDGVSRHPDQFYELLGDMIIAAVLIKIRRKLPEGAPFFLYLVLFSILRFFLFFVRGNVPEVLVGLKNGQWTALVILALAVPAVIIRLSKTGYFHQVNQSGTVRVQALSCIGPAPCSWCY